MDLVEFGRLRGRQRAELEGEEDDPFDAAGSTLRWRAKERHVGLRGPDGRLMASAGLVLAEVHCGDAVVPVVGIGGVIVAAPFRGQGLGSRIVTEALERARSMGPGIAMLFCHRDRAGLYARHAFLEVAPPVLVEQDARLMEMPMVTMWRPLREDARLPEGQVVLRGLPF